MIRPPGRGSGPPIVPKTAPATRIRPLDLIRANGAFGNDRLDFVRRPACRAREV